ncbi:S24 family peptidase [Candidatus Thioglobus sp.]|nr:S24 family peptidase [Candidatus Thioglobus sp.]
MSTLDNPKALFQNSCSTNSEPYALQNIGNMMSPEFSENCILIIDPSMPIHHKAYVIIDFNDELYFRQYFEENGRKILRCLNSSYSEIELNNNFEVRGCIIQQKQRKHKSLHYYLPNAFNGEIEFTLTGKEKTKKI